MQLYNKLVISNKFLIRFYNFLTADYIKQFILIISMKNILEAIERRDLDTLVQVVIAYSSFVGISVAIIYYISEIKKLTISEGHIIVMIYIIVALIILWIASKVLIKIREVKHEH